MNLSLDRGWFHPLRRAWLRPGRRASARNARGLAPSRRGEERIWYTNIGDRIAHRCRCFDMRRPSRRVGSATWCARVPVADHVGRGHALVSGA